MNNIDDEFFNYLEGKGFNERWFYLASLQNLFLYVVNGFSNENTAIMTGLCDADYVKIACQEFLGFDGWEEDLDYSPLFKHRNNSLTNEKESDIIKRYIEYRKELDDFYDRDEVA